MNPAEFFESQVSLCQVPRDSLHIVSGHPLHIVREFLGCKKALNDRRALSCRVEFADQGGAVVDQVALL